MTMNSNTERHTEALSSDCEAYLTANGLNSFADHKDGSDPADIYTIDGDLVVIQVPRDISAYYLMRLIEHGREQYAKGLAAAKLAVAEL